MLQSVSRNIQPQNMPQGTILNQSVYGQSSVQTNKFSSQAQSAQSGLTGSNLAMSDSQQDLQMINNTNQIYGFQQSSDQSSNIYSSQSISNNISGPNAMHQQVQQQIQNQNVTTAFEQVNQLKQLHQRLLDQQMSNQSRAQTHSIPSQHLQSHFQFSAQNPASSGIQRDDTNLMQMAPLGLNHKNSPQQNALRAPQIHHNNLRAPQPHPQAQTQSEDVSANINQKLIQLKQQLEQQQHIQHQRQQILPQSGETKLQMQLRQHIINQQKKSSSNSSSSESSEKSSPKSAGANKRDEKNQNKQKKKVSFSTGYSSGESSSKGSSKPVNKRSFNQMKPVQEVVPAMTPAPIKTSMAQMTPSPAQPVSKFQMYDHTSEQKKRRLQIASYKQNEVFHTSGNRLIPMIPKSILGVSKAQPQTSLTEALRR